VGALLKKAVSANRNGFFFLNADLDQSAALALAVVHKSRFIRFFVGLNAMPSQNRHNGLRFKI
jgi:hypothetical protein